MLSRFFAAFFDFVFEPLPSSASVGASSSICSSGMGAGVGSFFFVVLAFFEAGAEEGSAADGVGDVLRFLVLFGGAGVDTDEGSGAGVADLAFVLRFAFFAGGSAGGSAGAAAALSASSVDAKAGVALRFRPPAADEADLVGAETSSTCASVADGPWVLVGASSSGIGMGAGASCASSATAGRDGADFVLLLLLDEVFGGLGVGGRLSEDFADLTVVVFVGLVVSRGRDGEMEGACVGMASAMTVVVPVLLVSSVVTVPGMISKSTSSAILGIFATGDVRSSPVPVDFRFPKPGVVGVTGVIGTGIPALSCSGPGFPAAASCS